MGAFYVDCIVESIENPAKQLRIDKLLVNTGSEYTWLPEEDLKQLPISPRKKDVSFIMTNGEIVTREVGYAILYVDPFETIDEVVFGKPGDMSLLGARTLEGFGAVVDSRQRKIVAAGPIPAAGVSSHSRPARRYLVPGMFRTMQPGAFNRIRLGGPDSASRPSLKLIN